jgi:uncharacterized protein YycO
MRVCFYKGKKRLFDRFVQWWQKGNYSHVEIQIVEAGLSFSSSFRDGGVRAKAINYSPDRWDFVEVACDSKAVIDFILSQKGKPYDLLGLFGFILRPVKDKPDKWFCSELIAASLGYSEPWRYCPNTLYSVLTKGKV